MNPAMKTLRRLARRYPEVEEGIACEGSSLERMTLKVGKKAFLFLGATDAMVKLRKSLPAASKLAAREPGRYKAGASGWVKVLWGPDGCPPLDLLKGWIEESYRLMAPSPNKSSRRN